MDDKDKKIIEEIVTETIDNGTIENVHIAPIGEFLGSDAEGNPVPEKIDAESLQKLADSLNASETEVLADVDHGAAKPGVERETRSAGWFTRFVVDPLKGLFATLKLTKHGKELLENREYRYISPTFSLDEDGRPVELHTASLTNLPAFKGHINPILNTEAVEVSHDEGKLIMEMTKEELVALIKETVAAMNSEKKEDAAAAEVTEEVKEEVKEEVVDKKEDESEEATEAEKDAAAEKLVDEIVENACSGKTEVKNETSEPEVKEEEKKEEVIKMEALNSAPTTFADVSGSDKWKNLHGDEFWKYLAAHPEIKG